MGSVKLWYNHWRVRKYTKLEAEKKAIRQEMRHSASVRRGRAKDIPFGVRALERGVVVEGVWHSKANTPVPSLPGSPLLPTTASKGKSREPTTDTSATGGAIKSSVTRIEIPGPTDHLTPEVATDQRRGRPNYKPRRSSGLRFNDSLKPGERRVVVPSHEDQARAGQSSKQTHSSSSSESPFVTGYSDQEDATQLDPLRRPRYYSPSANSSHASQESNPFLTPGASRRQSVEEPLPLSHLDVLVPLEVDGDATGYHAQMLRDAELQYGDGHAQPPQMFDAPMQALHASNTDNFEPNREERQAQVIRKVNSGFQILRPGSLAIPRPSIDNHDDHREDRQSDKKQPRKLRKKGRRQSLGRASIQTQ